MNSVKIWFHIVRRA